MSVLFLEIRNICLFRKRFRPHWGRAKQRRLALELQIRGYTVILGDTSHISVNCAT